MSMSNVETATLHESAENFDNLLIMFVNLFSTRKFIVNKTIVFAPKSQRHPFDFNLWLHS